MASGERPTFGKNIDIPTQPVTDTYARRLLSDLFTPSVRVYTDSLRNSRDEVLSSLARRVARAREVSPGLIINRVTVSALGVQDVSSELEAAGTYTRGRQDLTRMYNEVVLGMDGVVSPLISAHEYVMGVETKDKQALQAFESGTGIQLGLEGTEELFDQQKADYERIMESLRKDPTGKSALYRAVKQLTRDVRSMKGITPAFVIAGAEFAERYYGMIYPLVDELIPPAISQNC